MNYTSERALSTLESGRVMRYHAAPTVGAQTDGQHAWGVAALCIYLTDGTPSAELMVCAVLHDAAELVTGDIPFTVKQGCPEIKTLLKSMEKYAHAAVVMPMPELSHHELAVLKIADTLEGLIWCMKTEQVGPVKGRWSNALEQAINRYKDVVPESVLSRAQRIAEAATYFQP